MHTCRMFLMNVRTPQRKLSGNTTVSPLAASLKSPSARRSATIALTSAEDENASAWLIWKLK